MVNYIKQAEPYSDFRNFKFFKITMRTSIHFTYRKMTNKESALIVTNSSFTSHPESIWELRMNHLTPSCGYSVCGFGAMVLFSLTTSLH